jgi:hypothetical protein
MKQKNILNALVLTLLVAVSFSCENRIENGDDNNASKKLELGQMEAKAYPDRDKKISFWASSQKITIDWGDGVINELIPNGVFQEFSHEYANQNLQTIKISTEDLRAIGGSEDFPAVGAFQELRFANCPKLQTISWDNQPLTIFELEKADSLFWVDCSNNQLSSNVLNDLFRTLPEVEVGYIYYKGNIGAETCDFAIAGNKGWKEDELADPPADITINDIFSNEENIAKYLTATLESTETFFQSWKLFESLYANTIEETDLLLYNYQYKRIYNHELDASNNLVFELWGNAYKAIRMQNLIIAKVAGLNKPEYRKYVDAALVLRASTYFIMVNCWGDVPFINEKNYNDIENSGLIKRTSESVILSELIRNLLQVEDNLLLANIYTYQKDTEKSLSSLSKILSLTRDTEAILLAAENYLKKNNFQEAISLLNEIRIQKNRLLLEPNATATQITEAILEGYKLDLREEGLYFFTLKRFDKAESVLGIATYQKLLPIPAREVDSNPNITQNPGYE